MAVEYLPFIPSENNYKLRVTLGSTPYLFNVHWNVRNQVWYMDILKDDETPIANGLAILLGATIGAFRPDPFFQQHILSVIDTSGESQDAGFDDLGDRVRVVHIDIDSFSSPA